MATRNPQITRLSAGTPVFLIEWVGLLNGDVGAPVEMPDYGDLTVTMEGTFGSGGSVSLKGSNDLSNYIVLTDPQGNPITKTAGGLESVTETPRAFRPEVTAGDGATNLQCRVLARRGSR